VDTFNVSPPYHQIKTIHRSCRNICTYTCIHASNRRTVCMHVWCLISMVVDTHVSTRVCMLLGPCLLCVYAWAICLCTPLGFVQAALVLWICWFSWACCLLDWWRVGEKGEMIVTMLPSGTWTPICLQMSGMNAVPRPSDVLGSLDGLQEVRRFCVRHRLDCQVSCFHSYSVSVWKFLSLSNSQYQRPQMWGFENFILRQFKQDMTSFTQSARPSHHNWGHE